MNQKEGCKTLKKLGPRGLTTKARLSLANKPKRSWRLCSVRPLRRLHSLCVPTIHTHQPCTPWLSKHSWIAPLRAVTVKLRLTKKANKERHQPQKRSQGFSRCLQPLRLPLLAQFLSWLRNERVSPLLANQRSKSQLRLARNTSLAHYRTLARLSPCMIPSHTWRWAKKQNLQIKQHRWVRRPA